jgi:hypothetical protein
VTACDPGDPARVPAITLTRGRHVVRTSEGVRTGMQIDRVVLASAAGGDPLAVAGGRVTGLGRSPLPTPSVTVVHNGETRMRVHVTGADAPFWLVLGQSHSDGWKATIAHAGSLGPSRLVDGYANGWLVRPPRDSFDVVVEWTPQRRVWAALWISAAAALACLALIAWSFLRRRSFAGVATRTRSGADVRVEWPAKPRIGRVISSRDRVVLPILVGLAATLVVAPWAGAVAAAAVVLMQWRPPLRVLVALAPATMIAFVTVYVVYLQHHFRFPPVFEWPTLFPLARPLGWLAVVLLAVDVVVERAEAPPAGGAGRAAPVGDPPEM